MLTYSLYTLLAIGLAVLLTAVFRHLRRDDQRPASRKDDAAFDRRIERIAADYAAGLENGDDDTPVPPRSTTDDIPYGFDATYYRNAYPDVAHLSAEDAAEHFRLYGSQEGRLGVALASRETFIARLQQYGSVLEIGPFCNPIVRGENVRYLDMLDAGQLHARATEIGIDASGCPERIHYLGGVSGVDEMFDAVVSSHSIEHQPDLIDHLQGIARILRPGAGRYYLLVPDKRYCFDHFIPSSTIAEVIQAHEEKRTTHTLRSVVEHHALTTHNDPAAHWQGIHGERRPQNQPARIAQALDLYRDSTGYLDVHAWYFTPTSFWDIMSALHATGMIGLRPVEIHPTARNTLEFYVVLERDHHARDIGAFPPGG